MESLLLFEIKPISLSFVAAMVVPELDRSRDMKKTFKTMFIILAIFLIVFIVLPFLGMISKPISKIGCTSNEINIKTGQTRFSRYFFGYKVSEKLNETFLSKILETEISKTDIQPWHPVITRCMSFNPSPHYKFHGAFFQISKLEDILSKMDLTKENKKEIVEQVIALWQISGDDYNASKYILSLEQTTK